MTNIVLPFRFSEVIMMIINFISTGTDEVNTMS